MALISSYLVTTRNLEPFFNSLITAKAPDVFTQKFLESLEFKSTNDRLYIALLKGLGFLDTSAVPTERYYNFLDQSQSKHVLAEAVREAYSDLFAVHINANDLSTQDVKNKLRTLTQGKNSEQVIGLMANTFSALVKYAEWESMPDKIEKDKGVKKEEEIIPEKNIPDLDEANESDDKKKTNRTQFHYNIQIHLPESRDNAVYDAIFRSLKKHLF